MDRRDQCPRGARVIDDGLADRLLSTMRFHEHAQRRAPGRLSATALVQGIAPDGGLYVPQTWPQLAAGRFRQMRATCRGSRASSSRRSPRAIALDSQARRDHRRSVQLSRRRSCRSTPDGRLQRARAVPRPDRGVQGFRRALSRRNASRARAPDGSRRCRFSSPPRATPAAQSPPRSTTGPASECRCCFPKGLVSPTQERQLTCWGGNVRSFAVRGTFDDCQRMVKEAFVDAQLRSRLRAVLREQHQPRAPAAAGGVLRGDAASRCGASMASPRRSSCPAATSATSVACLWARSIGLPIGDVVLAHNANRTVPDYFESGDWRPRASVATLACAMDVGNPSNMERLRALFPDIGATARGGEPPTPCRMTEIRARIRTDFERYGQIWCPHTAVAAEAYERLPPERRRKGRWVLVATAHPAKFREIVEPLIGARGGGAGGAGRGCSRARRTAPRSTPTSALAARGDLRLKEGEPWRYCRNFRRPPGRSSAAAVVLGWVLVCASGAGIARAARTKRSSPPSLRAGSDHLVDVLVPDGMGGNFHVDFLLLTSRGILVIDLRDVTRQHLRRRPDDRVDGDGRRAALHLHQSAERAVRPHRRGEGGGGRSARGRPHRVHAQWQVPEGPAEVDADGRLAALGVSARRARRRCRAPSSVR